MALLAGLDELRLVHVDAPSGPSLSPSRPVLQEHQLAALQSQLPSLHVMPQQQQRMWQAYDDNSSHRIIPGCTALGMVHAEHSVDNAILANSTETSARANTASSVPECAPATDLAVAACPAIVVVFLSNTMGSTSYGVAQDASVHIIRGEVISRALTVG